MKKLSDKEKEKMLRGLSEYMNDFEKRMKRHFQEERKEFMKNYEKYLLIINTPMSK